MSDIEREALLLSLQVASAAVLLALPAALALAWALARARFAGKALLEVIVNLPLVLPPVVIGYALLVTFGRQGPLGRWLHDSLGIQFVFTFRGAVLAAAVMALPLMVRAIRQALEAVDAGLEAAARLLAQRHGIEMPITETTYRVLFEGLPPRDAVLELLSRAPKAE